MLINNDTYQRETLSERPIRQPLKPHYCFSVISGYGTCEIEIYHGSVNWWVAGV